MTVNKFNLVLQNRRGSRVAFTLVELLAVVAVVGTLMFFVFGAAGKARERMHLTTCAGNLKQIGLALNQYLVEHNGVFPGHLGPDPNGGPYLTWYGFLGPYVDPDAAGAPKGLAKQRMHEVFRCPANPNKRKFTYESHYSNTSFQSYGYNMWWVTPYPPNWGSPRYRNVQIPNPTEWVVIADIATTGVANDEVPFNQATATNTLYPGRGVGKRHFGGCNLLFLDGHVAWRDSERLQGEEFNLRNWNPTIIH